MSPFPDQGILRPGCTLRRHWCLAAGFLSAAQSPPTEKCEGAFLPFCFTAGSGSAFSRHRLAELSSEILVELVLASHILT